MNYRPPHDPRVRPSIIPEKRPPGPWSMIVIALQLLALLLLVRLVMLEQDLKIIYVPLVDPLLQDFASFMKRWLTVFGLM